MKDKILSILKTVLLAVVYPTIPLKSAFMGLAIRILKLVSSERDTTASKSFEFYFNKILSAKNKQQSLELEIKIEELGKILGFANTASSFATVLIYGMYFTLMFAIPGLVYFFFSRVVSINFILSLGGLLSTYYTLLLIFLALKNWGDLPNQDNLRLYILKDFSYIYAKSMEIDPQVADIAMETIAKSVLLKNKQTFVLAQKNLNKTLGL
ncbi:MAG: hypothetical protein RBR02_09585 [Desulfuromonadaceae bacterium]|nr:hypothetical protein [Desulfuromonadaceae bacterium]